MQVERSISLSLSLLLTSIAAIGQEAAPGLAHPMDLPVEVAGNFMELRNNHFHSGIDLKTRGRAGQPVRSTGEGWVSRIKISPWGYGKAVYIDHPTGFTTVYAHLDRLNGQLASTLLDLQYTGRSFSLDKYFRKGELPVQQGEVIAFSGNTGGSTAPHLHYEVRRTADQRALDPEAHGIEALDRVPPTLTGIRIHPLDSNSSVSPYPAGAVGFIVNKVNDSTYVLKPGTNAAARGVVGLSVNAIDRYSNSHNTCGIRSLQVSVDGRTVCDIVLDEVDFGVQRHANAYMDYGLFKDKNMHYNRCYKLPNNRLDVYGGAIAPGRIAVEPGKSHAVQVIATDRSGNASTLTFVLQGATAEEAAAWPTPRTAGNLYRHDRPNELREPGMRFALPAHALHEDSWLRTAQAPAPARAMAPLFTIQDASTPLLLAGELSIEVPGAVPDELAPKLLAVRMVNGRPVAEGGRFAEGRVTASVRTLGQFTVMADTTPPVLAPVGLHADMKGRNGFQVRVRDDLSGVDQWHAQLDGQWILMEYEPKTRTLEHSFDKYSDAPGTRTFTLEVSDERGNRSSITRTFTR